MARARARETARYLLRATNTGISGVVGPDGAVLAESPQFTLHALRAEVLPLSGATPYVRLGDAPVVLLALVAAVGCGLWQRRRAATRPGGGQGSAPGR